MIVKGEGPKTADIVLVGEAPGEQEEKRGRPFVGRVGAELNSLLNESKMARGELYITNVVKERPPGNDFNTFYDDGKARRKPSGLLVDYYHDLWHEIIDINPKVIIALGAEPLRALTGKRGITNWRGSVLEDNFWETCSLQKPFKVVPTFHPSFVMQVKYGDRTIHVRPTTLFDLRRAYEESLVEEWPDTAMDIITAPTLEQIELTLERMESSAFISFDIETAKWSNWMKIDCIAFADTPHTAISVPIFNPATGAPYWSPSEEARVWRSISRVMASPAAKVGQNATYDMTVLMTQGVHTENFWMDTMNAHQVIYAEFPKTLEYLVSIYTKFPYYKYEMEENRWLYNGKDAAATLGVAETLERFLKEEGLHDFYHLHINPMIPLLTNVSFRGLKWDDETAKKEKEKISEKIKPPLARLKEATGKTVVPKYAAKGKKDPSLLNLSSSHQVKAEFNLPDAKEDTLYAELARGGNPALKDVLDVKKGVKMRDEFLSPKLSALDGRLHTTYVFAGVDPRDRTKSTGTTTGRLASRDWVDESGRNLQNPPEESRTFVVPNDGNVFIGVDLSQAEARGVAYLSGDLTLLHGFESGVDIHSYTAAMIFHRPYEEVGRGTDERYISKHIVHAANYLVGARTAKLTILKKSGGEYALRESVCKAHLQSYLREFPGIQEWHDWVNRRLDSDGFLINPMGRKKYFYGPPSHARLRAGVAFLPQSLVADIITEAMLYLTPILADIGDTYIALQIHDALVVETPEEKAEEVAEVVRRGMEMTVPITDIHGETRELLVPAEAKIGRNWGEV